MPAAVTVNVSSTDRTKLVQRLESHRRIDDHGCWIWTGSTNGVGYGVTTYQRRKVFAHRMSYTLHRGPIPDGLVVDHICGNTLCFNPEHLEPVTDLENKRRSAAKQTHCKRGHPFDEVNTYVMPSGHRQCRRCRADRQRALVRANQNKES